MKSLSALCAALAALGLVACGGAAKEDAGGAMVSVRSSAAHAFSGTVTLRVYNRVDFTGSDLDIWNWSSDRVVDKNITGNNDVLDSLPVGNYTFCAQDATYGPTCVKPVTVTKNRMAAVAIILQQAGNDGQVTIDSPLISGVSLSDGAPHYGEAVTMSATVTGDGPLSYAWSFTCGEGNSFSAQAPTTVLTSACQGAGEVTLVVSNGQIRSSVTFPLTYSPQGANVSVALNNWPVFGGFVVPQAQLAVGEATTIDVVMRDDEIINYAWSASCGTIAAFGDGSAATFTGTAAGDCTVTVAATDPIGGKSTASVILHVGQPSFTIAPSVGLSYCDGGVNQNNYGPASPLDSATWSGSSLILTKADSCSGVGAELLGVAPVITSLAFDVSACSGTAPRFNVYYGTDTWFCGCSAPGTNTFTSCNKNGGALEAFPSVAPDAIEIVLDTQITTTITNIKVNGAAVP